MTDASGERTAVKLFFETQLGKVYLGDSLDLMRTMDPHSVDLIMTSPPFGLVRKKDYGNVDADKYLEWFRPFASEFHRLLKSTGSLVIDIGGAWIPGQPTRSLYHYELDNALLYFDEDYMMRLNEEKAEELVQHHLHAGLDNLRGLLGTRVHLPADHQQWPRADFIRSGNRFRRIPGYF